MLGTGDDVFNLLRFFGFTLLCSALMAALAAAQPRTPVIVELFTSEGCSSCPPADRLLADLEREQPIRGVQVIALGEHVDYWNELGWPDRFSTKELTARQRDYGRKFVIDSIYTPQMVVNGQAQFTGGDAGRAAREIRKAAEAPRARVELSLQGDAVHLNVGDLPNGTREADVLLAVTETDLATDVKRGENRGHVLRHAGVVRSLTSLPRIDPKKAGAYTADARVTLAPEWKRENLTVVVFVQDRSTGKIIGAAAAKPI